MAKQPKRRFTEHVTNPDLFREDVRAAPPPTGDPAALVAAMRTRRLEYEELQHLRATGPAAVPLLLSALRDDAFLFRRYDGTSIDDSAPGTALSLLEPFAEPPAAVLEPAVQHPDAYFRRCALYYLARCANDDAIPALIAGLSDPDAEVRTYTLIGLAFLGKTGRGSERFRAALFDAVVPLLDDPDATGRAARAVLRLDHDRAVRTLTGPAVLRPDNRRLCDVLGELKEADAAVPADRLHAVLVGVRDRATAYPFDYAFAAGLPLLARADPAAAGELAADARAWGNDRVRAAAAEVVAIAAGVTDAWAVVAERADRLGTDALTEPQVHYLTLANLDAEVRNGGFAQYFFNSSGDLAARAPAAAVAVGTAAADVIADAISLFGPAGPAADRDTRMDQLSRLGLDELNDLDRGYYRRAGDVAERLAVYAAEYAAEFRRCVGSLRDGPD